MEGDSTVPRKAQLDKAEREHLEDVVTEMRDRVEANVRYQLEERDLETRPDDDAPHSEEVADLVTAIDLESADDDDDWSEGYEQYITGVGYTIVNRLAALRCMEVRDFIDPEVTVFREDGLTPAADRLVTDEFMLEEEAVLQAYQNACDELAEEIEILFDRSTALSLIDPDDDTFEDLCGMLDEVPDEVWRGDDVLGWVYEYYNVKLLDDLRRKGDRVGLDPEDVPPANQFYTPHWVVRMLTDNSLGKLYLEDKGQLHDAVERQKSLSPDERKYRPLSPADSPDIADFCTYLVPSEEEGEPPEFDGPEDLRVIDPACGSGHFLLYAFDVLERIYRAETDLDHAEIPREILKNNLYGVDLDMRACQLAAFNLYLKGRTRTEEEGADGFDMPGLGIVCADSKVADVEGVEEVFDEVAAGKPEVEEALGRILDAFEEVHGLGSLLDVRGTLGDLFEDDSETEGVQITLGDDPRDHHTLGQILHSLRQAVDEQRNGDSFLAQDLRSFVRLLDVLAQDYDVALMNPPYGSQNRMPNVVQEYIYENYKYTPEYYLNFFEVCNNIVRGNGRVGMLVPRSFMYRERFQSFRTDFIGTEGGFDFLAEFGYGILDNATVPTVATVVRATSDAGRPRVGDFIRLHDIHTEIKQSTFVDTLCGREDGVTRLFSVDLEEFENVPRNSLSYSTPREVRQLHQRRDKIDAETAKIDGNSKCRAMLGVLTGNKSRFYRKHWEVSDFDVHRPIASGGPQAWTIPHVVDTVEWGQDGKRVKRSPSETRFGNESYYGSEGLAWTYIKRTGRRFGYYPGGLFSYKGLLLVPREDVSIWKLMSIINSDLYNSIFLSQTWEREWNAGEVGAAPWIKELFSIESLERIASEQYESVLWIRSSEPTSPYYVGAELLPKEHDGQFYHQHPHTHNAQEWLNSRSVPVSAGMQITNASQQTNKRQLSEKRTLEELASEADSLIYSKLDIEKDIQEQIRTEIFLRTAEEPEDREINDPSSVPERPDNLNKQVKDLVHHFAMEAAREAPDNIVPLKSTEGRLDMHGHIVKRFEKTYHEHAEDRLVEVDDVLGSKSASDEAYPNLRAFIEEDLFEYHVESMENTPILWKLTTERLLADAKGEGFACFVDYHQIDASLFDRLSAQYLEPRKAELRERRSAANQRRNDESLSTTARAEATETFERCSSGLEQIAEFEEVMQELGSTNERDFDEDDRERAEELVPKVAAFREETARRIETMAELHDRKGADWFEDEFTPNFWDKVEEWREEWLDALSELEYACEEYSKPSDQPVEAYLADLFNYFNWRLKGSDHYSSSGILFMTYYFDSAGADMLDDEGEPYDHLSEEEKMLASLAMGLEDSSMVDEEYLQAMVDKYDDDEVESIDDLPPLDWYKALAEEIDDRCQAVYKQIPSDWKDRALSEVTTAGYQPNHKHGVAINITPLAEKRVVPEVVRDKVL